MPIDYELHFLPTAAIDWINLAEVRGSQVELKPYLDLGLFKGILYNLPVCRSVGGVWSIRLSLNIPEIVHQFFLILCMNLGHHESTIKRQSPI